MTELFLIYSSALILSDTYGTYFLSLINLRNFIYKKRILRIATLVLNCILFILNIFIPMSPGPILIGDFLPAINLFVLIIFYVIRFTKDEDFIDVYRKYDAIGFFSLGVFIIHFLFPRLVIL